MTALGVVISISAECPVSGRILLWICPVKGMTDAVERKSPQHLGERDAARGMRLGAEVVFPDLKPAPRIILGDEVLHSGNEIDGFLDPRLVDVVAIPERARRAEP